MVINKIQNQMVDTLDRINGLTIHGENLVWHVTHRDHDAQVAMDEVKILVEKFAKQVAILASYAGMLGLAIVAKEDY